MTSALAPEAVTSLELIHRTEVRGSDFLLISISALQDRLAASITLYEKETNGGCGHVYSPGS